MMQEKINFEEAKNKALEFVKQNGPSMPAQVASVIKIPPLFASALLSQLISEKSVKASHLKIGGTPLYYINDHKDKLLDFTNYLPGKEKEVCDKLRKEGIIIDEQVQLGEKVALRNLKDFSIPLSVKVGESKKLFWKWYSLPQEEALKKLEGFLQVYERRVREQLKEQQRKEKKEIINEKVEVKPEKKVEIKEAREIKEEQVEKKIKEPEVKEKPARPLSKSQEEFLIQLREFLATNQVKILEEQVNKKERTVEMVLELTSSLGKMNFFAIAKNKKVLTAADLMLAYYRSQEKKLPLILLNSGKFAKNAEDRAGELGITLKSLEESM